MHKYFIEVMILKYFYDLLNKNQSTLAYKINLLPNAHPKHFNNFTDGISGIFPGRKGNINIRDYC